MKASEISSLKPLDKVIWWKSDGFGNGKFVIAWICSGERIPPFCLTDSRIEIRVSNIEKEAKKDIGTFVRAANLQTYKESVWNEVERLNEQELEIARARENLRNGKIEHSQLQAGLPFFNA